MKIWLLHKFYYFFFKPNCWVVCVCPRVCISVCVWYMLFLDMYRTAPAASLSLDVSGANWTSGGGQKSQWDVVEASPCVHREEGIYLLTILLSWAKLEEVAAPGSKRVSDVTRRGFWTSWLFSPGHLCNVGNKGLVQSWWTSNSTPWGMLYGRGEKVIEALA